jgi:hypothetical protein
MNYENRINSPEFRYYIFHGIKMLAILWVIPSKTSNKELFNRYQFQDVLVL